MQKMMTFEHLDTARRMRVVFHIDQEGDHWRAQLEHLDAENREVKAPTFYGSTPEQAERQLRKVFEREYELVCQESRD